LKLTVNPHLARVFDLRQQVTDNFSTRKRQLGLTLSIVGFCSVTQSFLDEFTDLLERLSTFSSPLMISRDFGSQTDINAGKVIDCLARQ